MKVDGVEYPDHVVEAFMKVQGKTDKLDFPRYWFEQHLITFYQGWEYAEKRYALLYGAPKERIRPPSMSDELHIELDAWLQDLIKCGGHPTVEELEYMVSKASIISGTMRSIGDLLDYEGS